MTEFNRETVTAAFEEILAEYGEDHHYERQQRGDRNFISSTAGCFYTLPRSEEETEYKPACIVGQLIAKFEPGVLQELGKLEEEFESSRAATTVLRGNWTDSGEAFTQDRDLIRAISAAQGFQDNGGSWGDAVEEFKSVLARL